MWPVTRIERLLLNLKLSFSPHGRKISLMCCDVMQTIIPHHISLAIHNDAELDKLLSNVTVSGGGVLANIHPALLPPGAKSLKHSFSATPRASQKKKQVVSTVSAAGSTKKSVSASAVAAAHASSSSSSSSSSSVAAAAPVSVSQKFAASLKRQASKVVREKVYANGTKVGCCWVQ